METKYGKHIIREPFYGASAEFGGTTIFKHTDDDNSGIIFEHQCIDNRNWSIDEIRTHETHGLLCFIGGNPENIRDLGAEVRLCLGNNNEEHIINDATVVSIPPGLKHGRIAVNKLFRPFILLRITNTLEYQKLVDAAVGEEEAYSLKKLKEGSDVAKYGKYYWMNMVRGPLYVDYEPGWTGTSIWAHHNEYKNGSTLGYHCIVTPYDVQFTHAHDFHEMLCFLSSDPKNIRELGAEVSICLGDEMEKHTFNTPAIISIPPGLKHCPLLVKNITRPIIFLEISTTKEYKGKPEDK